MSDPYDPFDVRCSIDSIQSVVIRAENGEDWPTRVADLCKSCRALVMRLTLTEAYLRAAEKRAAFFEAHAPRTLEGDGRRSHRRPARHRRAPLGVRHPPHDVLRPGVGHRLAPMAPSPRCRRPARTDGNAR